MPLKLVQRHGSPCWYIRGSIRGVRVDESTGLGDRKAAEEILVLRSAQVQQRAIHGDAFSRTFAEAALSYMEAGGERAHLAPLITHFAKTKVGAVGQAELEAAAKKLAPGLSPATVNRKIYTPAVAVLNHAARKKWCAKPVIARPKQPRGRVRWVTHEEAEKLIAAASPHLAPLVEFLFCTGARVSEALYLDWRFVDLGRAHVIFVDTKNGDRRGVPLHPRAVAALANLREADPKSKRNTGAVFRRPDGQPYEPREGGGGQVSTAWAGMCRRAGISDFSPHDCRHTWATWHYTANRDLTALMELGGWKSPDMVMRYAHVNMAHLAPTIGGLWGAGGENAGTGVAIERATRSRA